MPPRSDDRGFSGELPLEFVQDFLATHATPGGLCLADIEIRLDGIPLGIPDHLTIQAPVDHAEPPFKSPFHNFYHKKI